MPKNTELEAHKQLHVFFFAFKPRFLWKEI